MTSEETLYDSFIPGTPLPWWLVLIQGIVLLILGIYLLTSPYQTLAYCLDYRRLLVHQRISLSYETSSNKREPESSFL